jgi:hypothetical protein
MSDSFSASERGRLWPEAGRAVERAGGVAVDDDEAASKATGTDDVDEPELGTDTDPTGGATSAGCNEERELERTRAATDTAAAAAADTALFAASGA